MKRTWILAISATAAAGVIAAGVAVAVTHPSPVTANTAHGVQLNTVTRQIHLIAQPVGNVSFGQDAQGHLTATLHVSGLTPGSAHGVLLASPGQKAAVTTFDTLTADNTGQVTATLASAGSATTITAGAKLEVLEGATSAASQQNDLAAEPIADTMTLPADSVGKAWQLRAEDVKQTGKSLGTLRGSATISFDPNAHTVVVTVQASGLPAGAHAAHIHIGSCTAQGDVAVMLPDLTANASGRVSQTVHAAVDAKTFNALPASGFYLNIHQGDGNSILDSSGNPTLGFRPMLCGNV